MKKLIVTTLLLVVVFSAHAQTNYYETNKKIYIDSSMTLDINLQDGLAFIKNDNDQNDDEYYLPEITDKELNFVRHYASDQNNYAIRKEFGRQLATLFCALFPKELAMEYYNADQFTPITVAVYYDKNGAIHSLGISFNESRNRPLLSIPPEYYANFMKAIKKIKIRVVYPEAEYYYGTFCFKIEADQLPM